MRFSFLFSFFCGRQKVLMLFCCCCCWLCYYCCYYFNLSFGPVPIGDRHPALTSKWNKNVHSAPTRLSRPFSPHNTGPLWKRQHAVVLNGPVKIFIWAFHAHFWVTFCLATLWECAHRAGFTVYILSSSYVYSRHYILCLYYKFC